MMKILAIGQHPCDIEFGCGGTIFKYKLKGNHLEMLIIADQCNNTDSDSLKKEQEYSASLLGVKKIHWGELPETDSLKANKLNTRVKKIIDDLSPDLIFVNTPSDTDYSHKLLAEIVLSNSRMVRNFLYYETITTIDFKPQVIVDITSLIDDKYKAIKNFESLKDTTEHHRCNLPEYSQSLGKIRGRLMNVQYAEAFEPHRLIINL
ncbi:MAG: PIG-L family deacetylase [Acidobacteria bacterium]|nr:PIG-L family deacetylase [Acidobacteriota bacterium]